MRSIIYATEYERDSFKKQIGFGPGRLTGNTPESGSKENRGPEVHTFIGVLVINYT